MRWYEALFFSLLRALASADVRFEYYRYQRVKEQLFSASPYDAPVIRDHLNKALKDLQAATDNYLDLDHRLGVRV